MKKLSRFQPKPVAKAVTVFAALIAGSSAVHAGPGFGDGRSVTGTPVVVPTYFANSPAGARQWVNGAPASFTVANQANYKAAVTAIYPGTTYPGTGTALRKFVDPLPLPAGHALAATNPPQLSNVTGGVVAKYIPVAVPAKWVNPQGVATADDYYEIAVVEYSEKLHSDLKKASTLRGYVQIDHLATNSAGASSLPGSKKVALTYPNGTPILVNQTDANGKLTGLKVQALAFDTPHYLGPLFNATKDVPTRVKFLNLLPVGHAVTTGTTVALLAGKPQRNGDLFLPHDDTLAGAGVGPDGVHVYTQNRANLHLQGGQAPWISAGSPHSWITPAGEADATKVGSVAAQQTSTTAPLDPTLLPSFLRGASAINVPDMNDPGAGAMTYYFPNSQSARMEWIRDQTVGIDRLNTYAGMVAPYLLTDPAEQALITTGAIPGPADTIPLILQDKTFVPDDIKLQDAKWDINAWGTPGDLWYPHVYEKVQDAAQATGFNVVGRWHWGPNFWPSTPSLYDVPTGVYRDAAGVSQATVIPEAFMDTPLVNGVAYPTLNVEPKPYRLRILNAANDRFFTFNLFVATNTVTLANGTVATSPQGLTEVPMLPVQTWPAASLCAPGVTKSDGVCTPELWTSDVYANPAGVPDWKAQGPTLYQIASDGGLLPGVAPKDSMPLSYLLDKGRAAVLNVLYPATGLQLGTSERADVVVDFSAYAGKTLIVYNDSGSPVPGTDPRNDYFTNVGDSSDTGGAEDTRPGFGPNVRTMMQIVVAAAATPVVAPAVPYILDPVALDTAVKASYLTAQETPIVAQSAYNGVYNLGWTDNKSFASIFTGTVKEPMFSYVPGTPGAAFNSILVQNSGVGYTRIPSVTLTGGGGTGATAETTLKVASLPVVNHGSGYTLAPTVTIVATNRGSSASATATLGVNAVKLAATGNTGYTTAPLVTFSKPLGKGAVQATGTAVIAGGKVTGITITNPGQGYTIPATVTIAAPAVGLKASGTADMGVYSLPLDLPDPTHPETAGGGGYDDLSTAATEPNNPAPGLTITLTAPQLAGGVTATAGALGSLYGISLTNSGTGYTSAPSVVITPSALEPTPAGITAATAVVDTSVAGGTPTGSLVVKTKAIQELWETTYGRYNTTFGVELPFTSANVQTTMPLNYVDVPTEELSDGETQIWKITHNGLLTQALHFTMADVQLINRVGWDNFNTPPEPNELGWKDTVKLSPLEDGIIAIRAKRPKTGGFGLPNSVRMFDPSQPAGSMSGFTQIDPYTGAPAAVSNLQQDYGWEYLWQGTVLGRNPVDFQRPVIFRTNDAVPAAPSGLAVTAVGTVANLAWADNATTEYSYRIERSPLKAGVWAAIGSGLANSTAYADATFDPGAAGYDYRVWAVGQNGESVSNVVSVVAPPPVAPTGLAVTGDTASTVSLTWLDVLGESSYLLAWTSPTAAAGSLTLAANSVAGTATGLVGNTAYAFTITASSVNGSSTSQPVSGTTAPAGVTGLVARSTAQGSSIANLSSTINLSWANTNANIGTLTSIVISGTVGGVAIAPVTLAGTALSASLPNLPQSTAYALTVTVNGAGGSTSTAVSGVTAQSVILAAAAGANAQLIGGTTARANFALSWNDLSLGESGYQVQVCFGTATQCTITSTVSTANYPGRTAVANSWYPVAAANVAYTGPTGPTGAASATVSNLAVQTATPNYYFRVAATGLSAAGTQILGATSNITPAINLTGTPAAPTSVTATAGTGQAVLSWVDNAINNASYDVQQLGIASIATITLQNAGTRYTVVPTITISAPAAGGVQATAHLVATPVTRNAAGTVTGGGVLSVVIDNAGTGYAARPTITLTGGTRAAGGTAAVAGTNVTSSLGAVWITPWTTSTVAPAALGNASGATVTGLTRGVSYQFQVRAVDMVSGGTPLASAYVGNSNGQVLIK